MALLQGAAIALIESFAWNQINITKEANTRRGVTKKSIAAEKKLIASLFKELTGKEADQETINSIIENIS